MPDRRPWRLDAAAFSLLAAGLLVCLAVFSLDPADRPGAVYPAPAGPRNLVGTAGAWLGFALTDALDRALLRFLRAVGRGALAAGRFPLRAAARLRGRKPPPRRPTRPAIPAPAGPEAGPEEGPEAAPAAADGSGVRTIPIHHHAA